MRQVHSASTAPERIVRSMVHCMGYRFRLHRKDIPGTPDLSFISKKKVIFVIGCFWHGHGCGRGSRVPKTNRRYWTRKIERNRQRDMENLALLHALGWSALVVWECQVRDSAKLRRRLRSFLR
jgi:DNA mismatch endonuclease (patch repair protein)